MTVTPELRRDYFLRQVFLAALFGSLGLFLAYQGLRRHMPLLAGFGASSVAVWAAIAFWNYRQGPRSLDRDGVTRRDGRRFLWKDLTAKREGRGRLPGGQLGPLNHLDLVFPTGAVRVFPFTLENAGEVMETITRRTTPCPICGTLGEYHRGFQKGGREAEDTFLPAAAGSLVDVRKTEDGLLQKCPECGDHFLYQSTYEFLVSGSEDEQVLTRVVM